VLRPSEKDKFGRGDAAVHIVDPKQRLDHLQDYLSRGRSGRRRAEPASAESRTCARCNRRTAHLPALNRLFSSQRSSVVKSIRYRTFIRASSRFEAQLNQPT
jgi:hypothetical protein